MTRPSRGTRISASCTKTFEGLKAALDVLYPATHEKSGTTGGRGQGVTLRRSGGVRTLRQDWPHARQVLGASGRDQGVRCIRPPSRCRLRPSRCWTRPDTRSCCRRTALPGWRPGVRAPRGCADGAAGRHGRSRSSIPRTRPSSASGAADDAASDDAAPNCPTCTSTRRANWPRSSRTSARRPTRLTPLAWLSTSHSSVRRRRPPSSSPQPTSHHLLTGPPCVR